MNAPLSRRTAIVASAAAFAAGRSGLAEPAPELTPRVAAFARSLLPSGAPGASVALVGSDGVVHAAAAGWADVQRRTPMTPTTRMMSGSTGKTFCAATAMAMVSQGRLSLDAPVAPWFKTEPWFARLPNAQKLTLRILMMHASGFPQFLDLPRFQMTFLGDSLLGHSTGYPARRMLSFILDAPAAAALGQHHYSDLNYDLVALTLERAGGRSYYTLMQELVLSKLGVGDVVPAVRRDIPGLATGYARGDMVSALAGVSGRSTDMDGVLRHDPSLEFAGGGLALTPRALALLYWKLARGQIVPPSAFAEMMRSSIRLPDGLEGQKIAYGLGLFITRRPNFGAYISHSGFYPGYHSNVGYFLDHGFAAAVQVNTDSGPEINDALRTLAKTALPVRT